MERSIVELRDNEGLVEARVETDVRDVSGTDSADAGSRAGVMFQQRE